MDLKNLVPMVGTTPLRYERTSTQFPEEETGDLLA